MQVNLIRRIVFCLVYIFVLLIEGAIETSAQIPVKEFYSSEQYNLLSDSLYFKIIPFEIKEPISVALQYYPELKDTYIRFRIRKRKTPLSSRPTFAGLFRKTNQRQYVITISSSSKGTFNKIVFDKLPYNAKIGVIGHELGHIVWYKERNNFQLFELLFKLTSWRFVNKFEFNTDLTCIQHGLGYQLYDWSMFVVNELKINGWKGVKANYTDPTDSIVWQRYMTPGIILKYISELPIYKFEN